MGSAHRPLHGTGVRPMPPAPTPRRRLSVLVVDDLADAAESTAAVLAPHGFAVAVATSGEAVLRAAADPPDVVILDIMMPGMDGYELARRLRGQDGARKPL